MEIVLCNQQTKTPLIDYIRYTYMLILLSCSICPIQTLSFRAIEQVLGSVPDGIFGIPRWWDLLIQPGTFCIALIMVLGMVHFADVEENKLRTEERFKTPYTLCLASVILSAPFALYAGIGIMLVVLMVVVPLFAAIALLHWHLIQKELKKRGHID